MIRENNLGPDDIWNIDETAFCLYPKKSQTISPKGSKAYKITQGGGRENNNYCWCGECERESNVPSDNKPRTKFAAFMARR